MILRAGWLMTFLAALLYVSVASAPAGAQERIAVLTEPGTPVVAVEILLTVGPADEGPARAGLANLAGRAVLAEIRPALDSLGVRTNLVAEKDALAFSLIAAPEVWEASSAKLLASLFGGGPASDVVLRERSAIVTELRGRAANPADAAIRELDRTFYGEDHPWGRPTVGTPESVSRLTAGQVGTFMAEAFVPGRVFVAVVGPIDAAEARAHLMPALAGASARATPIDPFDSETEPLLRNYDSITSWVSASYSFPASADEEAIRFATFLTADALSYSPAQRSVYNVWSEVMSRADGGEVRIQVVVPPDEAVDWADRLQEFVTGLVTVEMHEDIFDAYLRRFRGERIMALIAPEARAHAAARGLFASGREGAATPDLTGMTLSRLRAGAALLEPPSVIILGPVPNLD